MAVAVGYSLLQDSPSDDSGQQSTGVTAAVPATSMPPAATPSGGEGGSAAPGVDGATSPGPQADHAGTGVIGEAAPGQPDDADTGIPQPTVPEAPATGGVVAEPTSGSAGETITVRSDRDAVPGSLYQLKIHRSAAECPRGTQIGGPTAAGQAGEIAPTRGVVPEGLTSGTYHVCFAATTDASRATTTAMFTIV